MSQGLSGKNTEVFTKPGMFVNVPVTLSCFIFFIVILQRVMLSGRAGTPNRE